MDAHSVKLVQESFEDVAKLGDTAITLFYDELFAIDPSLRKMFKSDMTEQRGKLNAALALVIRSLHAPEKILTPVKALAVKHVSYGVEPGHYTLVGNALLRTLAKGLGDKFTPELRQAWVEAFGTLANIMKEAAYGGVASGQGGIRKAG
jgi:hemoglobin-like flavoprotein